MFDIAPSELLLVAVVALVVIGPKDLPRVMRTVGYWMGRARGITRQFRAGFDAMVREAELEELKKQWATENERIMREHPMSSLPAPAPALPAASVPAGMSEGDSALAAVQAPPVAPEPAALPHPAPAPAPPKDIA